MKKYLNYAGRILFAAGVVEIIIGLLHFIMPYFVIQSNGFSQLSHDETAFLIHAVIAVGIAIIPFGILTILFSLKREAVSRMLFIIA